MANVLKKYKDGIRYAYSNAGGHFSSPSIDIGGSDILRMTEYFLGIVDTKDPLTVDVVRNAFSKYQTKMASNNEALDTRQRFYEGCYTVGYMKYDGEKPFYIVAQTHIDGDNPREDLKFQGDVKRYSTLSECPELGIHVPIIRAWAEGQSDVGDNELGLPRRDRYYPEIDVVSGYASSDELWFLIPKKAP